MIRWIKFGERGRTIHAIDDPSGLAIESESLCGLSGNIYEATPTINSKTCARCFDIVEEWRANRANNGDK